MVEAILIDNVDGSSAPVGNVDTVIKTATIKATNYPNVRIQANIQITTTGSPTLQNLTFKIKLNGTQLAGATWIWRGTTAIISVINQPIDYITDNTTTNSTFGAGGTLTITCVGAIADAATTTQVTSLYVTSVD